MKRWAWGLAPLVIAAAVVISAFTTGHPRMGALSKLGGVSTADLAAIPVPANVRGGLVAIGSVDDASDAVVQKWSGKRVESAAELLNRMDEFWSGVNSVRVWNRATFNRISAERPNKFAYERSEYWMSSAAAYCAGPTFFVESPSNGLLYAGETGGTLLPLLHNPFRLIQSNSFMPLNPEALLPLRLIAGKPSELLFPQSIKVELMDVEKFQGIEVHRLRFHHRSSHGDMLIPVSGPPVPVAYNGTSSAGEQQFSHWEINPRIPEETFRGSPPSSLTRQDFDLSEIGRDLIGRLAPDCAIERLDGTSMSLAELRGKQGVVLAFWSTTCGPCMAELAMFPELSEGLGDDAVLLAVNSFDSRPAIDQLIADKNWSRFVGVDQGGQAAALYECSSVPHLVVIDRDGIVRLVYVGVTPRLVPMVEAALELKRGK